MDVLDSLIEELQTVVNQARKAPFSNNDIVVSKADMLGLIARLRDAYPQEIREAKQIIKEREEILNKAENYANQTMDAAEAKAKKLVSNEEVLKKADADAKAMRSEAEEHYSKLDYEARSMAFGILDQTEKAIQEGLAIINDRKRKLIDQ